MQLFMYTMASDYSVLVAYTSSFALCPLRLENLFAYTTFFSGSCEAKNRALVVMMKSISIFCVFFTQLTIGL